MALEISFSLSWFFFCLAAMVSSAVFLIQKKGNLHRKQRSETLPSGEMGLPWIGETMDFYRAQRRNRLFEDFVQPRITKHGKIFKTRLMGSPTIVINGAEANRFILSNEFKLVISSWPSSSVQLMGKDCIMAKEGDKHRCLRGLIAGSLSDSGLESLLPKMCDAVRHHLEQEWQGKEEISLYRSTKALTFTLVFECLLGISVKPGMLDAFERVLEGVFAPPVQLPGSKFSRAKKARHEIEQMLTETVREKRYEMEQKGSCEKKENTTGLFSSLVLAMINREISEKEVIDNVVLLVFAAHDTTSFAIAMTFKMLAKHPHCYTQLLEEHVQVMSKKADAEHLTLEDVKNMKYTWQVARESMRLFPPIFGSFRKAVTDIEYCGFTIPKGWKVLWTTYGTHYNHEYFQDPLHFDPSRFEEPVQPYSFLPFGGGPRLCAGYKLAKMNILIFLYLVTTRYNWSMIYREEPITVDPLPFPSYGMPIRISPKVSSTQGSSTGY